MTNKYDILKEYDPIKKLTSVKGKDSSLGIVFKKEKIKGFDLKDGKNKTKKGFYIGLEFKKEF